ncbi:predicted protein [Streptomyces viridochromogenes DSM 40736]|uniref:Predicted protein n=1 Tax=Streptomyces viridochromogenes (strain DSM 40736 / JCM 4977 / BCRC 1201 / Tue 494) TaxID=591159 RepID=D9X0C1_STRVT|nr:hypothetical protein [Streptomyces viridochromogenes]EFL35505.1 predicted protein [Streptomyces viridochromogenes DSM 40736]
MQLLHIEAYVGDRWQRVVRLGDYEPPSGGAWDENLMDELETFLAANLGPFWIDTADNPHGVLFGPGVPRLFRLAPAT